MGKKKAPELTPAERNVARIIELQGSTIEAEIRSAFADGLTLRQIVERIDERFGAQTSTFSVRTFADKFGVKR